MQVSSVTLSILSSAGDIDAHFALKELEAFYEHHLERWAAIHFGRLPDGTDDTVCFYFENSDGVRRTRQHRPTIAGLGTPENIPEIIILDNDGGTDGEE